MQGTLSGRVYLWLAWLFLVALGLQVFFIGLQLFAGADSGLHMGFGYLVLLLALVLLIGAFAARLPDRSKRWAGALLGVTILQVVLAGLAYAGLGALAALHPVNALLVFWVTLNVLRDAREQVGMPAAGAGGQAEPEPASTR